MMASQEAETRLIQPDVSYRRIFRVAGIKFKLHHDPVEE